MAIIPPLDRITKAPALGVDKLQQQFNNVLDSVVDQANQTIKDSVKLPNNVSCDDPRVKKIKQSLESIQSSIDAVRENIPKIQEAVSAVNTIVSTAQGIKATIATVQLANPITAPLFIAMQLEAIQNELIVNAIESIKPLQNLPGQIESKLLSLTPPLVAAISKLNTVCNDNDIELTLPTVSNDSISNSVTSDSISNSVTSDSDYNDLIETEFYNEFNVSDIDISGRADSIRQLIDQQRDLLNSLQEAPSQVYKQDGEPPAELGKIGDYYINTINNVSYGPKISTTDWGNPLN